MKGRVCVSDQDESRENCTLCCSSEERSWSFLSSTAVPRHHFPME